MAAKRFMYSVEYRRFYLRDLESVVIWPNRWWWLRLTTPAVLLGALGMVMWQWSIIFGAIFGSLGLAWLILEAVLGPTAKSCLRHAGMTTNLPVVMRTRRAAAVLGKIDAALRAARANEQPATPADLTRSSERSAHTELHASPTTSVATATETNAS